MTLIEQGRQAEESDVSDQNERVPTLSVGIPVYNGERYLEGTLDALLDQTFEDFEIIVCDNASTDRTAEIVAQRAARDDRVRYVRNPRNIGLAKNFNRCFQLSRGRYFKWAMSDDLVGPTNLADQVAALEADPEAVLAVPGWQIIDADGVVRDDDPRGRGQFTFEGDASNRLERLIEMICGQGAIAVVAYISGVVRTDAMWATDLLGSYPVSDHVWLAQLAMQGRFVETRKPSLQVRLHANSAGHGIGTGDYAAVYRTFYPGADIPRDLVRWRFTRYREFWRLLGRGNYTSADRRRLRALYAGSASVEFLRDRVPFPGLLPSIGPDLEAAPRRNAPHPRTADVTVRAVPTSAG